MSKQYLTPGIVLQPLDGCMIYHAVCHAVQYCKDNDVSAILLFNDIPITVSKESDLHKLLEEYNNRQ